MPKHINLYSSSNVPLTFQQDFTSAVIQICVIFHFLAGGPLPRQVQRGHGEGGLQPHHQQRRPQDRRWRVGMPGTKIRYLQH